MKTTRYLHLWVLLLFLSLSYSGYTQDIHWSQIGHSPLNFSPAMTGAFDGDIRLIGNFRNQWPGVVDYNTFSGSYDQVFYRSLEDKDRIAGGLLINYDEAGDSKLSNLNLSLNASYTRRLSLKNFLTLGFQLGFIQRGFKTSDLEWGDQWNGREFIPTATSLDLQNFTDTKFTAFPDFSAGINWHFKNRRVDEEAFHPRDWKRTAFDLGAGIYHINKPEMSFLGEQSVMLEERYTLHGKAAIRVDTSLDILGNALYQFQDTYDELVFSGGVRFHLNHTITRRSALDIGLGYRFFDNRDAIFPYATFHFRDWRFGLSYDINISEFSDATSGYGGPELSVQYIIRNIRLDNVKICPIF